MYFDNYTNKFPIVVAMLAQVICVVFLRNILLNFKINLNGWSFVFVQSVCAAILSVKIFKLPKWFLYISFLIPIAIFTAFNYFNFSGTAYGIIFVILAISFSHTLKERVPLYLSNNTTQIALNNFIKKNQIKSFIDLGSGLGGVVRATSTDEVDSVGVESAPLLFVYSFLLSFITRKGKIIRKNIWDTHFQDYQLVYAFLSPAIMEKLYLKVKKEMVPGTFFISNSFIVENVLADYELVLDDSRKTRLYIYKM